MKALLRGALSSEEWAALAIAESEDGYRFMAPPATLHRVCKVLQLDLPPGSIVPQEQRVADEPAIIGFEPPRAEVEPPMHAARLRQVFVEPMRRVSVGPADRDASVAWLSRKSAVKVFPPPAGESKDP